MEYYYGNPLSVTAEIFMQQSKLSLTPLHYLEVRMLLSFKFYIENLKDSQQKIGLLNSDTELLTMMISWYQNLKLYFCNFVVSFNWLCNFLDNSTMKIHRYETYLAITRSNFHQSEFYYTAMNLIRFLIVLTFRVMKFQTVLISLTKCLLHYHPNSSLQEEFATLKKMLTEAEQIKTDKEEKNFVKRVHEFLNDIFQRSFQFYSTMPIFEVFCHDNPSGCKKSFNPSYRSAIKTALNAPYHYISEIPASDSLSSHYPDICILYRLHLESGKMINIHDIFTAFKSIVETSPTKKRKSTGKKNSAEEKEKEY